MNFWKGSQQAKKILRLIEEGVAGTSGKHTMRKLCKCMVYFGIIFAKLDYDRNILGNGCCDWENGSFSEKRIVKSEKQRDMICVLWKKIAKNVRNLKFAFFTFSF